MRFKGLGEWILLSVLIALPAGCQNQSSAGEGKGIREVQTQTTKANDVVPATPADSCPAGGGC